MRVIRPLQKARLRPLVIAKEIRAKIQGCQAKLANRN